MSNATLEILLKARDEATAVIQESSKKIGGAMTAIGGAVTAGLALSVKSAADEEAGVIRLQQALANVGVSYDDVKDSLEGYINATQQSTSIGDDKQREALAELVAITGDYGKALELLPQTLDLAIGKDMDMVAAAQVLGRVSEGNTTILTRYGIELQEGATATEALGLMQEKYGGQAEAYGGSMAGQYDLLKNNLGDVIEMIGGTLLPMLTDLFQNHIQPVIESVKAWIDENPELTKTLVIVAGAVGGLMAILGPLLMILPGLSGAIAAVGVAIQIATGPIGLIIIAITALIAIGVALWQNWDTVKEKAIEIWNGIADFFSDTWGNITEAFETAWNGIADFFSGIWDGMVSGVKTAVNSITGLINGMIGGVESGINAIIGAINSIPSVTIPDWVPLIGGNEFGIPNISPATLPRIPEWDTGGLVQGPGLFSVGPGVKEIVRYPQQTSGVTIGNITINANTKEGGHQAAKGLMDEMHRRGIKLTGIYA